MNLGTKLTFYLKFGANIVFMYLWIATIEIKSNKMSDQLIEGPSKLISTPPIHLPYLFTYFSFGQAWIKTN